MFKIPNRKQGYIMLLSILIIGAVGVSITVSLLLLGLDSSRSSFTLQQSLQAKSLSNTCAEQALEQVRTNTSFSGSGNVTLPTGTCTYTVTNTGGETRSVTATGTAGSIIRKTQVTISSITPQIVLHSWTEVADF